MYRLDIFTDDLSFYSKRCSMILNLFSILQAFRSAFFSKIEFELRTKIVLVSFQFQSNGWALYSLEKKFGLKQTLRAWPQINLQPIPPNRFEAGQRTFN